MFSLLYKVFYDRSLFENYVKKAKGNGVKNLFVLATFVSFLVSLKLFLIFSADFPKITEAMLQNIPEITIENGQITSPLNTKYEQSFEDTDLFFIFDTTSNVPVFNKLGRNGFYITKDALFVRNQNEIKQISLADLFKNTTLVINQENASEMLETGVMFLKAFITPVFFLISILSMFCLYYLLTFFYSLVSFLFTKPMKAELTFEERMRMASLSIMPAHILGATASLLNISLSWGMIGFLITLFYMYCFLKDSEQREENA